MKQRIITAIILLAVFVPVLVFSHTIIFPIVASVMSVMAVYEMLSCTGQIKHYVLSVPALIYALSGPLIANTRFANSYGILFAITIIFLFYLLYVHVFLTDKIKTKDIALVFMSALYITTSITCIVLLRNAEFGQYIYLFIFIGACVTDTFAYFGGCLFGKHKLCPKVSPKKTIEGAISGIIFCTLAFVIYAMLVSKLENVQPHYVTIAIIGAFISVISQFGDLAASAIKRDFGVKDYGNIFPGHGGILDRFDSILAVAPFVFILTGNPQFINIFK
ncbi:MAG: phosphatidate cytidylyltransferase [Ruminococcaceae bacterium]|nr:phosphatidate cytidylyltransferase [Oscillospiraceae bacterium]